MTEMCHLHNHSEYSLLDGMTTPEEIAEIVSTNGQVAAAVTDHGTMGGFIRFQKAAKAQGIKPIFGVEAYFVDDVNVENPADKRERYHLILLAQNDIGLENLFGINNVAWTEQFYYKPLIDFQTLEKYQEGIICLSGCMGGAVAQAVLEEDLERAESLILRFKNLYNDNYYLEIQPHNPPELNQALIAYSDSLNIPLVGTLDCHFPTKQDQDIEEMLLMMGQRSSLSASSVRGAKEKHDLACSTSDLIQKLDILYPKRRLSFKNLPLYVMGADEVLQHFSAAGIDRLDVLENSMEIAERCNAEIKLHQTLLPSYTSDIGLKQDSASYLKDIAEFMLNEKGLNDPTYKARLEEELDIIINKNFEDYFLILWDLVTWADSQGIARGLARGSAGGSLLAYVLGITGVDPVKHGLLFFRFINPSRNDFPDIDLDFEDKRRDEIKEYIRHRWGQDNVAGVAAYGTFKAKGAVKDAASTFAVPFVQANRITSQFETLEEYRSSEKIADFRSKYPEIERIATRLEGRYKSASAHAAGVVVSSKPLSQIAPIEVRKEANTGRKITVVAYDKDEIGEFGLIKFDALSVRAITVIKDCIKSIQERYDIDVTSISQDTDNPDHRVFEEFSKGNVVGIFQAEGAGYANLIQEMGIRNFSDLVVSNALVRPGSFVTQGKRYLSVRDGSTKPRYEHEILREILEETHGTYIFEEQVMKIAVNLAGFSWAEADHLRKIISKKKDQKEFDKYRDAFIEGASRHIEPKKAQALWNQIEKASLYMFNKSHATAYSIISYQTMWLKINYPTEFFWATLYNEKEPEKITTYIFDANRMGVEILPPDINTSLSSFSLDGDKIRFGLFNIMGCGEAAAKEILSKRPFSSFDHFFETTTRSKVKKNLIENLEKIGCFESIGHSPYEKERYFGPILNWYKDIDNETQFDSILSPCALAQESKDSLELYVIKGVVKGTKRTTKYFRIEIEDSSGVLSSFADLSADISKRDYVIALVGDQTIFHLEDFNEVDGGSQSDFANFLRWQTNGDDDSPYRIVYEHGIEPLPQHNGRTPFMGYLVKTVQFKTRKGKDMASSYFWIPEYGWYKTTVFDDLMKKRSKILLSPFQWVCLKALEKKRGPILVDVLPVVEWINRRRVGGILPLQ